MILSYFIELKDVTALQNRKQGRKSAKKRRSSMKKTWLLFGFAMAALVAVMVVPSPDMNRQGGITLYGEDPEVEVYGPVLPETIVGGYTQPTIQSVVLPEKDPNADNGIVYVYAAPEQKNYHMGTCKFAYASGQELTLYEAYYLGFTPGKCCDAPAYTGP